MVKFLKYRDLRNTPSAVWQALRESDAVAIVSNGEPRALMLEIEGGDLEGALELVRRVRAQLALSRIQADAVRRGIDRLSDAEIEDEIRAARNDRGGGSRAPAAAKRARRR
ncbi:MAG: hypothetical protein ABR599_12295 [Gemmatimonadota bacterium]